MQAWNALHEVGGGVIAEVRADIANTQVTTTGPQVCWMGVGRFVESRHLQHGSFLVHSYCAGCKGMLSHGFCFTGRKTTPGKTETCNRNDTVHFKDTTRNAYTRVATLLLDQQEHTQKNHCRYLSYQSFRGKSTGIARQQLVYTVMNGQLNNEPC